jgi:hypothetical protein
MRSRFIAGTVTLAASALLLAGCSFSVGSSPTTEIDAAKLATTAEDALEAKVGTRPSLDCGTDTISFEDDVEISCVLTDPNSNDELEAIVTLANVDQDAGTYDVNVQVAGAPTE